MSGSIIVYVLLIRSRLYHLLFASILKHKKTGDYAVLGQKISHQFVYRQEIPPVVFGSKPIINLGEKWSVCPSITPTVVVPGCTEQCCSKIMPLRAIKL